MNATNKSSAGRRRVLLAGAYAAAGIAVAITGWAVAGRTGAFRAERKGVVLVVSGDTDGWITPCGCTVNQSGGLPRRARFLQTLATDYQVVYADVGGVIDGTSDYHAAKAEAILRGEREMGLAVQNIGGAELALGPERLRAMVESVGAPFVSANAVPAEGAAVGLPARIVVVGGAGGLRVAFVGVVSPRLATTAWRVEEPREAILRAIGAIKGKYDRLIVLAYVDEAGLESLARDLPEADAVIGGPTEQSIAPHRMGGGTLVGSATRKGKFVLETPLEGTGGGRIVELNATFADDAEQLENVSRFRADLATRDFAAASTGLAPGAGRLAAFAGTASCVACHASAYGVWRESGHAHAWGALEEKGAQADPSCQVCHTTGYAAPRGFTTVAASRAMVNVGCEDCHGPAEAHVKDPRIKTPFLASAQCITCHDEENSPAFDYGSYWKQIQHGAEPAGKPGENQQ